MRKWLFIAAVTGALAVLLAAFGEHLLAGRVSLGSFTTFANATRYQMYHALAMGLAAFAMRGRAAPAARMSALLVMVGILLFCGSLYGLAFTGIRILGFVTPFGGLAMIAGWIALAVAALKLDET